MCAHVPSSNVMHYLLWCYVHVRCMSSVYVFLCLLIIQGFICYTPPSQAISALEAFDHNIRATFSKCMVVDTSNQAWQQAELSLSRGGLGIQKVIPICSIYSMSNLLPQIEHAFSLSPPLVLHLGCQSFSRRG